MKKYRMWCVTDNKWEDVIASVTPTQCPTNATHTVEGISVIDEYVKVNDGTATDLTLADYKQLRYNEIDAKTGQLIGAGFTYDSKTFSLSAHAQLNWSEIHTNPSEFPDPVTVSCLNSDKYDLSHANINAFWSAAVAATKGHLDTGRDLKFDVYSATDRAGVDAVVDNR